MPLPSLPFDCTSISPAPPSQHPHAQNPAFLDAMMGRKSRCKPIPCCDSPDLVYFLLSRRCHTEIGHARRILDLESGSNAVPAAMPGLGGSLAPDCTLQPAPAPCFANLWRDQTESALFRIPNCLAAPVITTCIRSAERRQRTAMAEDGKPVAREEGEVSPAKGRLWEECWREVSRNPCASLHDCTRHAPVPIHSGGCQRGDAPPGDEMDLLVRQP